VASVANDVCGAVLSPVVGKMYEHNLSEEASPANSNDTEADKKPQAQPDIEEGV